MDSGIPKSPRPPVAIVGLDVLFPGRPGPRGFWRDIVAGRDAIRTVPPTHWLIEDYYDPDPAAPDKTYSNKGAFLDPVSFDPMEFGIPPSSLASIDTAQLLALVVARNVLAEVDGASVKPIDRSRVSVILGVASATEMVDLMCGRMQRPAWVGALREAGLPEDRVQHIADRIAQRFPEWQENTFPGLLGNIVAGRIANRFNLGGSNFVTDAACASSLASVQAGLDELYLGRSRMVLVGGADALNDILMYMCFSKTPAFSRSGDIRPFSDKADGTLIGEGIGIFAIKLLTDAERDGDHIYAVLRGIGRSSDGRATSVYAPRPEGQASAIRRAYDEAGYACDTVELIENHGTGTIAGDAAEIAGLARVFGEEPARAYGPHIAIGSVKSQIGHTKAAAGSAGLFKAVMALHNKVLPPTIKVERPNPKLNLDKSPFYINTAARPWIRGRTHPRRAAVSSFGFGGSNFHVTVEEYIGPAARPARIWASDHVLVLLSASNASELRERMTAVRTALSSVADLPGFAAELAADFRADAAFRAAIVARSASDLEAKLSKLTAGETSVPGAHLGSAAPFEGKIAFLFPGQGSQYVGMGGDLAMTFDEARSVWDAAADLEPFAETPLHALVFPPPCFDAGARALQSERLTQMENAQPAIAAMSQSILAVLDRLGLKPDMVAGHSFGEIAALQAAGVLSSKDALMAARRRGLAMMEAAANTEGAMIAVPLPRDALNAMLREWDLPGVVVANDNAPSQCVLSGPREAIVEAARRLKARNVTAVNLPVSSAFHSSVVAGATGRFARDLADIHIATAAVPVFANASAQRYEESPGAVRRAMADQIAKPVRFREMMDALYDAGARLFIEVGPSAVLTGLVSQCLHGRPHTAIALDRKAADGIETFLSAIGQLAALGVPLAYDRLHHSVAHDKVVVPPAPKQAVSLLGTNYNKPYPPANGAAGRPAANPVQPDSAPVLSPQAIQSPMSSPPKSQPPLAPSQHDAVASLYQHLAQTHAAFQQSMAESHQAFLNVAAQALASLSGNSAPALPLPSFAPMPPPIPPVAGAQNMPPPPPVQAPVPTPRAPVAMPVAPMAAAAPPVRDLAQEVLAVVAEKTGYPADMLKLDMDLEAELGIDSIKQVEILSTIRERHPDLPEIDSAQLSQLRTLNAIIAAIRGGEQTSAPPRIVAAAPVTVRPLTDIKDVLLSIVADKTGYPKDMLDIDHDLEAELGIDSIKQVEILSAVREALPSVPEIDSSRLSELRSLRAILSVLEPVNPNQPAPRQTTAQAGRANGAEIQEPIGAVPRHEYVLRAAPAAGFALPGLTPGALITIASLSDTCAVADRLTAALVTAGFSAKRARRPGDVVGNVVLLDVSGAPGAATALKNAQSAIAWARAFATTGARGFFVTVQATGGTFGLAGDPGQAAWSAGLAALARTARREWPGAAVKAIDIGMADRDPDEMARRIVHELRNGSPDPIVALPDPDTRLVPDIVSAPLGADAATEGALRDGMVLVVSGGARGVTAAVVRRLAGRYRLKVAMLGRTVLAEESNETLGAVGQAAVKRALIEAARARGEAPSLVDIGRRASDLLAQREIRATLQDLTATDSEAAYHTADISDSDAVAAVLAGIREQWGPITGIIHAAGVLRDKAIAEKTDAQVEAVLATKVNGLDALLRATDSDPLEVICLFSSAAAAYGNAGQSDYAMANEILNKVAQAEARRRPQCVVKSIGWGPWDGGMVDASLKALFMARNIPLIGLEAGADFLIRELESGSPAVEVLAGAPMMAPDADHSANVAAVIAAAQ